MEKINCPNHCPANIVKDGFQRGKQRYQCKGCLKKFQSTYTYTAYNPTINKSIVTLLKEGCGIRNISRILQISKNTVLSRMLCISEKINKPVFRSLNREYEVDELWTFTGNKTNSIWVTYCIERESKTVIDFVIGRKNKETIGKLINKVLSLAPKSIFTDGLNIYRSLLPEHIHKVFRYCTNHIERFNLTLRNHIKRLSRKTLGFSKEAAFLEAHLKIYFWG